MTTNFNPKFRISDFYKKVDPDVSDKTEVKSVTKQKESKKNILQRIFEYISKAFSTNRPSINKNIHNPYMNISVGNKNTDQNSALAIEDPILDRYIDNVIKLEHKMDSGLYMSMRTPPKERVRNKDIIPFGTTIFSADNRRKDITLSVVKRIEKLHAEGSKKSDIVEHLEKEFHLPYEKFSENNIDELVEEFFIHKKLVQETTAEQEKPDNTSEFGYDDSIYDSVPLLQTKISGEEPDNTSEFGYDDSIYDSVTVPRNETRGKDHPDNTSEFGSNDSIYDSVPLLQTENRGKDHPDNTSEFGSNDSMYDAEPEYPVSEPVNKMGSLRRKRASI